MTLVAEGPEMPASLTRTSMPPARLRLAMASPMSAAPAVTIY